MRRSSRSTPRSVRDGRPRRSSRSGPGGSSSGTRQRPQPSCARRPRSTSDGRSLPSERFAKRAERELRREVLIEPLAELGLVAANGPNDPEPSLVVEAGRVVEIDGRRESGWDALDHFIARHGIDPKIAVEANALEDTGIARMLVDVDVPSVHVFRLWHVLAPARLASIISLCAPVEIIVALK